MTTRYLVDDLNPTGYPHVVEETGATPRVYTYGLQPISEYQVINSAWVPSFYGYDGLGSVRQLTNASGAITDTYEYDAFGNELNTTGTTPNEMLYRGEQYDSDLGLFYLRARYYNPLTGRFMSTDVADGDITDPATLHKYLYAKGDPIDVWDPTGRASILETGSLDLTIDEPALPALREFGQTSVRILCDGIETVEKYIPRFSGAPHVPIVAYKIIRERLYRIRLLAERLKKTVKFVRSGSPEVTRSIASAEVLASRRFPAFIYSFFLNALIVLIAIAVSLIVSVRTAAWFGVPALLAWNVYVLWLLKFSSRRWVLAAYAGRVYVRLLMARGSEPHVIVLEASEIASMSIKTVKVFVYGPEPELAEWLVIEPAQAIGEIVPSQFISFLEDIWTHDSGNLMRVGILEGRLTIGWKWCHPALKTFLHQVTQECPSLAVSPEEYSELDLNGIWKGRGELDGQQRQMLVQAKRLGFGGECAQRLSRYRHMSLREASAYLVKAEREEAGEGDHPRTRDDFTMQYPHL